MSIKKKKNKEYKCHNKSSLYNEYMLIKCPGFGIFHLRWYESSLRQIPGASVMSLHVEKGRDVQNCLTSDSEAATHIFCQCVHKPFYVDPGDYLHPTVTPPLNETLV
jgi:hypothetical protein